MAGGSGRGSYRVPVLRVPDGPAPGAIGSRDDLETNLSMRLSVKQLRELCDAVEKIEDTGVRVTEIELLNHKIYLDVMNRAELITDAGGSPADAVEGKLMIRGISLRGGRSQ